MKLSISAALFILLFLLACSLTKRGEDSLRSGSMKDSISAADSMELTVLCAVGMRQVLLELVPKFEEFASQKVKIHFTSSGEIVKWVHNDKPVDMIILSSTAAQQLVEAKKLAAGSVVNIATSHVGVAVAQGAPKPDISTTEAFRKAMLDAKTIACPDPAQGGASGTYIAKLFDHLGIAKAVKSKLVLSSNPEDEKSMPGYLVASGKAEIALHQMQELLVVPGIDIIGPLPEEIQETFVFVAAIPGNSKKIDASKLLLRYLTTPGAMDIIGIKGMKPAQK